MPADLMHHQAGNSMSRLAYGQSPVGLYAQNQPLPAGMCVGEETLTTLQLATLRESLLHHELPFL